MYLSLLALEENRTASAQIEHLKTMTTQFNTNLTLNRETPDNFIESIYKETLTTCGFFKHTKGNLKRRNDFVRVCMYVCV